MKIHAVGGESSSTLTVDTDIEIGGEDTDAVVLISMEGMYDVIGDADTFSLVSGV